MDFLVRVVERLAEKPRPALADQAAAASRQNPFLPPEPALIVAELGTTHLALLNKYPVVRDHLLIVTRDYQPQDTLLTPADFTALANCLTRFPSLGFYNAGRIAGASQSHRHLQLVPLPLDDNGPSLPVDEVLRHDAPAPGPAVRCSRLPFAHHWVRLPAWGGASERLALEFHSAYRQLLEAQGWSQVSATTAYNLLMTRDWMMLVPRRAEFYQDISLNALAFAGALLVRDDPQRERLMAAGPMQALIQTAGSV
jgi:ATP adenylyltransferase